ncbi:MAG: hypothetical protein ONB48_06755 [candidate division KSB1 bacterium]|nr:hypothetical protein [candidate division KSB1 bacterium]MDZ7273241.1 hypothetical protein [candidate division KSB1 bacterium]MDZ7285343.1 hypothetical protein [candidate division KSB1 bacterium]MDZ7298375.1 hypothetical protein [candidate division KSB1 bacterium]MDZ7306453.1 hypothetical protein [candidate division KSB1 bacterium]
MHTVGVRLHDATLNLTSNHAPLIAYAREHLHPLATSPVDKPHLTVTCHWVQGEWREENNPFQCDQPLSLIGKRMLGNADELIWLNTLRMKGLQLRFRRGVEPFHCEVAYTFHPKKEKLENLRDYEYKKYFSLMSYLVYYPLFWHLERTRGWVALHASALTSPHGSLLIGGLGGVGKTTTCVALMQQHGIALIAENIVLTDGEFVYPCYEPVRLNPDSLQMLGGQAQELRAMAFPGGLKEKSLFHFEAAPHTAVSRPAALFLPQFTPRRGVAQISAEAAAEKIIAMNRLTLELDDYGWYAAALDLHWPQAGQALRRVESVRRFAQNVRCFVLGIDRSAGVAAVVEDILASVR